MLAAAALRFPADAAPAAATVDGLTVDVRQARSGPEKGNRYVRVKLRLVRGAGFDTALDVRVRGRAWDGAGAIASDEARIPGARLARLGEGEGRRLAAPLFRATGVPPPARVEIAVDLCRGDEVRHALATACFTDGVTRPGPCGGR